MPKATTSPYVLVKKSGIHNYGIFAKKPIPKGEDIIRYVGRKITKKEGDIRSERVIEDAHGHKTKGSVYVFSLNSKYDIDGKMEYNTARFINHSCDPNCESIIYDGKEIWILALRDIKKGEELTYDYGYDIDNYADHPCHCGTKKCVGYIVADHHWPELKRRLSKKRKR